MMCLHKGIDIVSDAIKYMGRWMECDKLVHGVLEARSKRQQRPRDATKRGGTPREPDGGYVLEIGANIGACTLAVALANATVVALEPSPSNLFYLTWTLTRAFERHPEWAGRVTIYPVGAGDARTTAVLFARENNAGHSVIGADPGIGILAPAAEEARQAARVRWRRHEAIPVWPLDALLLNETIQPDEAVRTRTWDVLKIDAEGFECRVVDGARELIRRGAVKSAALEVHDHVLRDQSCSSYDLAARLALAGFRVTWPLPWCTRTKYGCDVVVPWSGCRWRLAGGRTLRHLPSGENGTLQRMPREWEIRSHKGTNKGTVTKVAKLPGETTYERCM